MGTLATIPYNKLRLCPENIRRSDPGVDANRELKASIETHGVLVSLIVTKEARGIYKVIAGARRHSATGQLIDEKVLPKGYPLPCYILDNDENTEEAALIENTLRAEMHPVDEYESYHRLHHVEHITIADIAARFGKPELEIKKRLALGDLSPELRTLCRDGKISIESLAAYTIGKDHAQQMECYKALKAYHDHNSVWHIRDWFRKNTGYTSEHKLVKLIGLAAYTKAGGTSSEDLFSNTIYLHDPEIVQELATKKLASKAEKVGGEGWGWVDTDLEFYNSPSTFPRRLEPAMPDEVATLEAEIERLEEEWNELEEKYQAEADELEFDELTKEQEADLEKHRKVIDGKEAQLRKLREKAVFGDEQKAVAGCVVTLDHNGNIIVEKGFVKKEQLKSAAAADSKDDDESNGSESSALPSLSQAVTDDLRHWNHQATQLELAYSAEFAYDLARFAVAWEILTADVSRYGRTSFLELTLKDPYIKSSVDDLRANQMRDELLSLRSKLELAWLVPDDAEESLLNFRALTESSKKAIVVWCTARSLSQDVTAVSIVKKSIDANAAKYWRPTTENFFKRVPRELLLQYGAEIHQDEDYPHAHRAKPKKDLAILLGEAVEPMPVASCWLPPAMRTQLEDSADA